jgi:glycerol uptake facilitator-like aquaporin
MKKYGTEFLGTCRLVLGGCGSAVLADAFPNVGIGLLGVVLVFGLTAKARGQNKIWQNHIYLLLLC